MFRKLSIGLSIVVASIFVANAGTISGTVTAAGPGGAAIAGAIVTITPTTPGGTTYIDTTSATGTYSSTTVAAGTYDVSAAATGYTTSTPTVHTVTATSVTTVNIALTARTAGVTVSGTVTSSTTDSAVVGAIVRLRTGGGTAVVESTTTTTGGAYTFDSVQAGTYNLNVSATGYTTQTVAGVTVAAAPVTRNIALVPVGAGVTVSGTVTNSVTTAAVVGAIVRLRTGAGTAVVESTTTIAGGAYSFASVAAGTYNLNVSATGYTTQTVAGVTVAATNVTRNIALVPVGAGVTVSGTVTNSVTTAAVVGAIVRLRTGAGTAVVESTTTIAGGAYSFDSVAAGTYNLNVSATGYTTQTVAGVTVAATNVTRNIALVPVGAGVTVSGTVTNSVTTAAVVGAIVRLRTGAGTAVVESTTTIAGGAYSFDSVQAGTYNLNVSATGYTTQTVAGVTVAAVNVTRNIALVPLTAGVTVSGVVTSSVTDSAVVGAIVRLRTGAGTAVVESTTTIAGGAYSFDSVQAGTYNLNVSATGFTTQTVAGVTVAAVNITRNIALVPLPAGVSVSGYVTDSSTGAAIVGAIVRLRTGTGTAVVESTTTIAGGAYTLTAVQAGTYNINVSATGYTAKTMAGVVVAGVALTGRNFQIVTTGTGINPVAAAKSLAAPDFTVSLAGIVHLVNFTGNGVIAVHSADGKLIYRTGFSGLSSSIVLPRNIIHGGSAYIVSIAQAKGIYRKQVILP